MIFCIILDCATYYLYGRPPHSSASAQSSSNYLARTILVPTPILLCHIVTVVRDCCRTTETTALARPACTVRPATVYREITTVTARPDGAGGTVGSRRVVGAVVRCAVWGGVSTGVCVCRGRVGDGPRARVLRGGGDQRANCPRPPPPPRPHRPPHLLRAPLPAAPRLPRVVPLPHRPGTAASVLRPARTSHTAVSKVSRRGCLSQHELDDTLYLGLWSHVTGARLPR